LKLNSSELEKEKLFSHTPIRSFDKKSNDKLTTNKSEQENNLNYLKHQTSKEKQIFKER